MCRSAKSRNSLMYFGWFGCAPICVNDFMSHSHNPIFKLKNTSALTWKQGNWQFRNTFPLDSNGMKRYTVPIKNNTSTWCTAWKTCHEFLQKQDMKVKASLWNVHFFLKRWSHKVLCNFERFMWTVNLRSWLSCKHGDEQFLYKVTS